MRVIRENAHYVFNHPKSHRFARGIARRYSRDFFQFSIIRLTLGQSSWLDRRVSVTAAKPFALEELSPEKLRKAFPKAKIRSFAAKAELFAQASKASAFFFVLSGKVRISRRSGNGMDFPLATIGKGEFLGEMALLTGRKRSARAVAVTGVKVMELTAHDLRQLLEVNSPFAATMGLQLATLLAKRLDNVLDIFTDPKVLKRLTADGQQVDVTKVLREMYAHCVV